MRRDWRGRLVPDLTIKRIERALILALIALCIFGAAVNYTIMAS